MHFEKYWVETYEMVQEGMTWHEVCFVDLERGDITHQCKGNMVLNGGHT